MALRKNARRSTSQDPWEWAVQETQHQALGMSTGSGRPSVPQGDRVRELASDGPEMDIQGNETSNALRLSPYAIQPGPAPKMHPFFLPCSGAPHLEAPSPAGPWQYLPMGR